MSFGRKLMGPVGWRCPKLPDSIDDCWLSDERGKWNAQPAGLPSLLESFIQTAKLYDILDEILDREELHDPVTPATDAAVTSRATPNTRTLLELDSMAMEWRDQLPAHLRYDPTSESSTETNAVTADGFMIPSGDLLVQAKRLYLRYCRPLTGFPRRVTDRMRFLHVRMLILRPALDHLFEVQQDNQQSTEGRAVDAPLEVMVLQNIAEQCVRSAQRLAEFLDAEIRSQDLIAWWYNVGRR